MKRNFISAVALATIVLTGLTSQAIDDQAPDVGKAALPFAKANVRRQNDMALSLNSGVISADRFSKGADGRWYPIDPDRVITGEELKSKVMGYGWESKYGTMAGVYPNGVLSRLGIDIGLTGGCPVRFSVSPGRLTEYCQYPGSRTLPDGRTVYGYHIDAELDTDADIISYAIGEPLCQVLLMRMIDDNHIEGFAGSIYYIFEKVPAEELENWKERYDASFWDFHP